MNGRQVGGGKTTNQTALQMHRKNQFRLQGCVPGGPPCDRWPGRCVSIQASEPNGTSNGSPGSDDTSNDFVKSDEFDSKFMEQERILRNRVRQRKEKREELKDQKQNSAAQSESNQQSPVNSAYSTTKDSNGASSRAAGVGNQYGAPSQSTKQKGSTMKQRQQANWKHSEDYLMRLIRGQQASQRDRELRERLLVSINQLLSANPGTAHLHVEPYGSYVTGVYSPTSDVDLALRDSRGEADSYPWATVVSQLRMTQTALRPLHQGRVTLVENTSVPVLKVIDRASGIEFDITVGNTGGVLNSQILAALVAKEPRFGAMTRLVKLWAQRCGLNSAQEGTLNSYCLTMMVLFYLQSSKPEILPPIGELYCTSQGMQLPRSVSAADSNRILGEVLTNLQGWGTTNTRSVALLLRQFFKLYADFIRRYFVGGRSNTALRGATISTWTGSVVNVDYGRDYIFRVEDPVDASYNVGRSAGSYSQGYAMDTARFILKQFQAAADRLESIDRAPDEATIDSILAGLFGKVAVARGQTGEPTHVAGATVASAVAKGSEQGSSGSNFGELLKGKAGSGI